MEGQSGPELGPVVRPQMLSNAMLDHDIGQRFNHFGRRPTPLGEDQQALAAELVDQVRQAHRSAIMRTRSDEIMVRMRGPEPYTAAIIEPQSSARFLLLWNFQPFATPDPFDTILIHLPGCVFE